MSMLLAILTAGLMLVLMWLGLPCLAPCVAIARPPQCLTAAGGRAIRAFDCHHHVDGCSAGAGAAVCTIAMPRRMCSPSASICRLLGAGRCSHMTPDFVPPLDDSRHRRCGCRHAHCDGLRWEVTRSRRLRAADAAASLSSNPLDLIAIDSCFAAFDAARLAVVAAGVNVSN